MKPSLALLLLAACGASAPKPVTNSPARPLVAPGPVDPLEGYAPSDDSGSRILLESGHRLIQFELLYPRDMEVQDVKVVMSTTRGYRVLATIPRTDGKLPAGLRRTYHAITGLEDGNAGYVPNKLQVIAYAGNGQLTYQTTWVFTFDPATDTVSSGAPVTVVHKESRECLVCHAS